MMNSLDKYLDSINVEKKKNGLENYTSLYPMMRVENEKLYIGVMLTENTANVWSKDEQIKADYWALVDPKTDKIIEFNKTSEKDFVLSSLIPKKVTNDQKEIAEYTAKKILEYENYLLNDIKNEELPIQKKLSATIGNSIEIDGEKVNMNDYLLANFEAEIKEKIADLVNVLIQSKYTSITFYYEILFNQIMKEYKEENKIDRDKLRLCIEIMNNYYEGVIGIENFFAI